MKTLRISPLGVLYINIAFVYQYTHLHDASVHTCTQIENTNFYVIQIYFLLDF